MSDPLARLRAFSPAPSPNDNASAIRGNLSLEHKQLNANILGYHIAHWPGSKVFGSESAKGLKMVEATVKEARLDDEGNTLPAEGQTICEITVEEGMLNVHGTLAGACIAHILDICTFSSLFTLGLVKGVDPSGVSTAMNLVWYSPALPGTVLSIVSTSLSMGGRVSASRSEVYDKKTGRLLASVIHTIVPLKSTSSNPNGKAKL